VGDLEVLFALLFAAVLLARAADHVGIPYPIVLVLGGLAMAFVPGMPTIELDAHVVLLVFVPPLLLSAGWYSSPRELRAESRALGLLALALVLVTMAVIAVAAHELVAELTWPAAFMLGAVVAPTDAVAAVATFASVRVPERVRLLVQGESLINDATGLTAFSVALVAATEGFSLGTALLEFVLKAAGGTVVGLAVAWVILRAIRRQPDVTVSVLLTVMSAYGSYVAAEQIGASGILAAAVCGLYSGWHQSEYFDADTRLTASAFWSIMIFALEALLFVLLGLQLKSIVEEVGQSSAGAGCAARSRSPPRCRSRPGSRVAPR
jgi:NhaP-type Na+/H+ or K+/H+ antiporter